MFETVDFVATVFKALGLVFVLQGAGTAIFAALYRARLVRSIDFIKMVGVASALAGIVCTLVTQTFEAARMAGELSGVLDSSLQLLNWTSDGAAASLVRVFGCILICIGLRASLSLELTGAFAVIVSFAMTGHTTAHEYRYPLAILLMTHVAIAAFWLASLPALFAVSKRESSPQVIAVFSTHATLTVPWLAVVGVAMAWMLLPDLAALATAYGLSIVSKAIGFATLLSLAAANKLRWVPGMQRGDPSAAKFFRLTVAMEYAVILVVLCVTASMTTILAPE